MKTLTAFYVLGVSLSGCALLGCEDTGIFNEDTGIFNEDPCDTATRELDAHLEGCGVSDNYDSSQILGYCASTNAAVVLCRARCFTAVSCDTLIDPGASWAAEEVSQYGECLDGCT